MGKNADSVEHAAADDTAGTTKLMASTKEDVDHRDVMRMSSHELVRRLNGHLGATLVALLAGVRDRKLPYKWEKVDGATPRTDTLQRLQVAMRVWMDISDAETDHVARAWFIGMNPRLGEKSPVIALREGQLAEVRAAATAFVTGSDE